MKLKLNATWEKNKTKVFCKNVLHETYLSLNLKIMWRKKQTQEINIISIMAERRYQWDTCIFIYREETTDKQQDAEMFC